MLSDQILILLILTAVAQFAHHIQRANHESMLQCRVTQKIGRERDEFFWRREQTTTFLVLQATKSK
jgi:hypothetical protein